MKFSKATIAASALVLAAFSAQAQTVDNWRDNNGGAWKNGTNELCWRDAYWTPATALSTCDGAIQPPPPAPVVRAPEPVPAPPPPPQILKAKVNYSSDALFDFDKAVLKPGGKAKLDELVEQLKDVDLDVIIATGHTDSIGTAAYNQKLSERRAEAVKAYLVSKGIPANRIRAEGKGKTQPIASNKTAKGRAENRRVEIEVDGTVTRVK